MRMEGGFYWIPLMPKEMREQINGQPRVSWPKEVEAEYRRLHADYSASKAEYLSWIRKDRDSRMNGNAKVILGYIVDCLNFETGRCDPSHQTIADEIELSVRTVERLVPRIAAAGWLSITRRGKTTTNFYRLRVPVEKINVLLDRVEDLRQQRADRREEKRRRQSDPTQMADHSAGDPTTVRSHDPTELSVRDPSELSGKPMKGTSEGEPLNKSYGTEGDGYPLRAPARETDVLNSYAQAKGA
jgi:hypothetical protein